MIADLRKLESSFAIQLLAQVEIRIDERRLKVASTLLAYLEDPTFLERDDLILYYASKYQIICRFVATFGNSTQDLTLRKRPVLDI